MINILGTEYITDKEAAQRYGYSQSWFQQRRCKHLAPKFVKLQGKGKVFYPVTETDQWFRENIQSSD